MENFIIWPITIQDNKNKLEQPWKCGFGEEFPYGWTERKNKQDTVLH